MGKRGPKAKTEFEGESRVHSLRLRLDVYDALAAAAAARGKTLSDEIQTRLRATFQEDNDMAARFGDERTFWVMRMIALSIQHQWNPFSSKQSWLDDPLMFDQSVKTINRILEQFRPEGEITGDKITTGHGVVNASDPEGLAIQEFLEEQITAGLLASVQMADLKLPLTKGGRHDHVFGRIKSALGPVVLRARPKILTAEDLDKKIKAFKGNSKRRHTNMRRSK